MEDSYEEMDVSSNGAIVGNSVRSIALRGIKFSLQTCALLLALRVASIPSFPLRFSDEMLGEEGKNRSSPTDKKFLDETKGLPSVFSKRCCFPHFWMRNQMPEANTSEADDASPIAIDGTYSRLCVIAKGLKEEFRIQRFLCSHNQDPLGRLTISINSPRNAGAYGLNLMLESC